MNINLERCVFKNSWTNYSDIPLHHLRMSTFIRGPICGTDNCPSRLWRIIDGRRTCQYGHVMEGDVEFNDDEDDLNGLGAGVITRRLNLTTNATGSFQSSQLTNSQLLQQQQRQSHKKFKNLSVMRPNYYFSNPSSSSWKGKSAGS